MWITKLALRKPVSVMLLIITLLLFGLGSIPSFHMEYIPEIEPPMYVIVTPYMGADPDIIDEMVSKPIEEAGSKIKGFKSSNATSEEGQSSVILEFNYSVDKTEIYMDLKTKIDSLILPEGAMSPIIMKISSNMFPVMSISVSSNSGEDILSYVNDSIKTRLEVLPGVGDVTISGGNEEYISISVDNNAMHQLGVTFNNISSAIKASDFSIPAGTISQGNQDISVSTSMDLSDLYVLKNLPITTSKGSTVLLSDVANVNFAKKPSSSISKYNGKDDIGIGIVKSQDASIVDVASKVESEVEKIKNENPDLNIKIVSNSSKTTIESLFSVGKTLLIAILLVMIVLFIFLGDIRASFIVGSSIPISLLMTLIAMHMFDFSLNVVTSTSLVMAIGLMVDNSIVVLESIYREKIDIDDYKKAAIKGVSTVGASVIASTITTIVVYLPLALLDGVSGVMFGELGYTIIFAMIASIISAITLVPYFYVMFKPKVKEVTFATKSMDIFTRKYDHGVRKILKKKKTTVFISFILLIFSFVLASFIPVESEPKVDEGILKIQAEFRAGTSIEMIEKQFSFIENLIANDKDIQNYNLNISSGKAVLRGYVDPKLHTDDFVEKYNKNLLNVPNMNIEITSDSSNSNMGGASSNAAGFTLRGTDLKTLKSISGSVTDEIYKIPGVSKVITSVGGGATKAEIKVDPLKAANYGLSAQMIGSTIRQINGEDKAGEIDINTKEYKIYIDYPENSYKNLTSFMDIPIVTQKKGTIKLSDVATIKLTDKSQNVKRYNKMLYIEYNVFTNSDIKKADMQKLVDKKLKTITIPNGVTVDKAVSSTGMDGELPAIGRAVLIAIFLVFLVMAIQFESPRFSIMVMTSVVFSFIGAFGLLFISRQPMSMTSLIGILMLMGIVVNNGILFVDTTNKLKDGLPIEEALIAAGKLRMRPILMTSMTTILSLIPVALSIGKGTEMLQAMGIVIIGGMVTSTLLVLFLMPTFYIIISKLSLFKMLKRK